MPHLQTFTRQHIDYRQVQPAQIAIRDIAHALSHICRFAGHTQQFYSVAQHSVLASCLVPYECRLEALLHDAAEAYCVDLPSPLKRLLPDYKKIEQRVDTAIRTAYGLPAQMSPAVKQADLLLLAWERRDILGDDGSDWPILQHVDNITLNKLATLEPWCPAKARQQLLERYWALTEGNE